MTYWVTHTFTNRLNSRGTYEEITVTGVSFESIIEASDYVKKLNEEHHKYMLRTQDQTKYGLWYNQMTEDAIEGGRRHGIIINDER